MLQRTVSTANQPSGVDALPLRVRLLGRMDYAESLAEQHRLHALRLLADGTDTLLLVEHPHVYTLGRNSDPRNILVSEQFVHHIGATIARNERGGEVTYHGPGQLVAYPIIYLRSHERSITRLVERMETAILRTLAEFGIAGALTPGDHGVWVDGRKIASIGMAVRRWVVLHGMALNVDPDLQYFTYINPCGHRDLRMTSMTRELGLPVDWHAVAQSFARHFADVFGRSAPFS
jgi:lipoyl synthase